MSGKNDCKLGRAAIICRLARWALCCALIAPFFGTGCSSRYAQHLDSVRRDFYDAGDVSRAKENLEKRQKFASRKGRDTLELDSASLDLYSGNLVEAKRKLVEVRDRFDELERQTAQKTGESLLQYWTDDNMVSYEGEDYEKVMIRVYLAIADLLDEGHDCKAYAS